MRIAGSISEDPIKPFLEVRGKNVLSGHLKVSGAKHSALVLMAASLLSEEYIHLFNVPELTDIDVMAGVLSSTGADIKRTSNQLQISKGVTNMCFGSLKACQFYPRNCIKTIQK